MTFDIQPLIYLILVEMCFHMQLLMNKTVKCISPNNIFVAGNLHLQFYNKRPKIVVMKNTVQSQGAETQL